MSEHRITENEELALRERVTVLEEWSAAVTRGQETLANAIVLALAGALLALTLTLMLRKRLS